ncbi:unnamed protein product, partial [Echinostoma caproni]|uniref:Tectonic-2 n=1 Tax=Echinostoma caproni TaxID=27848 RepID=A0A183BES4_9TREM
VADDSDKSLRLLVLQDLVGTGGEENPYCVSVYISGTVADANGLLTWKDSFLNPTSDDYKLLQTNVCAKIYEALAKYTPEISNCSLSKVEKIGEKPGYVYVEADITFEAPVDLDITKLELEVQKQTSGVYFQQPVTIDTSGQQRHQQQQRRRRLQRQSNHVCAQFHTVL